MFLIEVIGGIFLILYSFVTPIYMKLCLFTGIICIPYSIIILLKFINRKKKDYTLIFNKEFKKIGNLEFIEKTYTESENQMCVNHFNPMDRVSYDFIIRNFQKGLVETIDYINSH